MRKKNETGKRLPPNLTEEQASIRLLPREQAPVVPTTVVRRTSDGRLIGENGTVWAAYKIPLSPVVEAKDTQRRIAAGQPLTDAFQELADMTPVGMIKQRRANRTNYRQFHVLEVNLPAFFQAPKGHPLKDMLDSSFAEHTTIARVAVLFVRLNSSFVQEGLRKTIENVVDSIVAPEISTADYDQDFKAMTDAMRRAGLARLSREELRLAEAWWNRGINPATPMIPMVDTLHVFRNTTSTKMAIDYIDRDIPWTDWPRIPEHSVLRFMCGMDLDVGYTPADSDATQWVTDLVNQGAVCVSIRGAVEPGVIASKELDRQEKNYREDVRERMAQGRMTKQEQEDKLGLIDHYKMIYSGASAPPNLTNVSVVAVFPAAAGSAADVSSRLNSMTLVDMVDAQMGGMAHTWPCSSINLAPYRLEMPPTTLAHSGICSLSMAGDEPDDAALLGFTEHDRQPAWWCPTDAMDADTAPVTLIAGESGSGKTMAMLWLMAQFALLGHPVVFVDPKEDSDHSPIIKYLGGNVFSMDDLIGVDGVMDPLRFSTDKESGKLAATALLTSINPWGNDLYKFETPLMTSLAYGVEHGADCIGQALLIAYNNGEAPRELVEPVLKGAMSQPLMAAMVGTQQGGASLGIMDGLNLIKVGKMSLPLPNPGDPNPPLVQRIAASLVKTLVSGAATAVRHRDGIVALDEAWIFLGASQQELNNLGRLARSQRTAIFLATQRVSDAEKADLTEFISTGLVMHMKTPNEAEAACRLTKLEPTPERMARITAPATKGGIGNVAAPNWNSMAHLVEPGTRRVLRGSVGFFVDMFDRSVPVEVTLPKWFLDYASTNKADIDKRKAKLGY